MNWPFWSLSRPAQLLSCESIEPLLSLYADGMASAEETRLVKAHLPDCADCRDALSWMQATHRTLAARPVIVPPADLHSRIAEAIAASSAAPISLRPARSFRLVPAYAAAASLTVLGVLSYSLWHSPPEVALRPATKPMPLAFVPKSAAKSPQSRLPQQVKVTPAQRMVASNTLAAVKPAIKRLPALRKTAPVRVTIPEHMASSLPVSVTPPTHTVLLRIKTPAHILALHNLTASNKIAPVETPHKTVPQEAPAPKLAELPNVPTNQTPPVTVHILPPIVIVQPPAVQTASDTPASSSKPGDILGPVLPHTVRIGQIRSASYLATRFTVRQSSRDAANVMQSFGSEHIPIYGAIYNDTANK
jgi:hypothetical protein